MACGQGEMSNAEVDVLPQRCVSQRKTSSVSRSKPGVQGFSVGKKFARHCTGAAFKTEERLLAPHRRFQR